MASDFKWDERQLTAAKLIAADEKTQPEIAAECGVSDRTLRNWLKNAIFRAEIARLSQTMVGVAEEIRGRMERAAGHCQITRDQIVGRLVEIANASLEDFVDDDGDLDMKKVRRSQKGHLIKEINVVRRTSKDGASRITKGFKIESPLAAFDLLSEVLGLKKQAARNPVEIAREVYRSMRADTKYADIPDEELAGYTAKRFKLPVQEVLSEQ